MDDNIIEVVNTDYTLEMDNTNSYDFVVENVALLDYKFAFNKPFINSIELTGDKSSEELGLVDISILPTKEDVSNKITSFDEPDITDEKYFSAKCVADGLKIKADVDLDNLSEKGQDKFDAKANKATTLSGYGITDGANISLSNLNATAQAKLDVKANKATTLSGYGITDGANVSLSNINATAQAKFDAKANKATTLSGYGITDGANISLSNLNATAQAKFDEKANKSTTLSGYGIMDGADVDLSNLSDIGRAKLEARVNYATTLEGYGITDGANISLSNIDAAGQARFDSKADKSTTLAGYGIEDAANISANNFTAEGKHYLSGLSLPSTTKTSLSVGGSGTKYTAPANGWFVARQTNSSSNGNLYLERSDGAIMMGFSGGNMGKYFSVQARKGDIFTLNYSGSASLAFTYAESEV